MLTQIPDEYRELVNEAKRKPKTQFIAEGKKYPAGKYAFNNFNFKLNSQIIGHGTEGLISYALNKTQKVIAIISKNISNTQKNTILSTPSDFRFIKFGDKIAEEGDVSIIRYSYIDAFSIFSEFHFNNFNYQMSSDTSFSSLYKPLKSYKGNDIYNQYALDNNCSFFNSAAICRNFTNFNFPTIQKGTNISQLNPQNIKKVFIDDDENEKYIDTHIGGVFGIFSGVDIKYTNPSDLKLQLFQASEAETQVNLILPAGQYKNKSIDIGEKKETLFEYEIDIFDCEYKVIVNSISSVKVTNISFNSTEELMFNQRAGYKSQKEFQIRNWKSSKISKSSESIFYELLKTDIDPPSKNFSAQNLELIISIYTGLEVVLQSKINEKENNFTVKCGVEFKREINAKHNSTICPCPYLHGKNTDVGLFNLETINPFIHNNVNIVPTKKFYENERFWSKINPNSWCLGGNLNTFDINIEEGKPNSAILNIKSVRYGIEYKDKPNSNYKLVISIYDKDHSLLETIESQRFQFSEQSIQDGLETKLNLFHFIDILFDSICFVKFSCIDSKGVVFNDKIEYHDISKGFNDIVTLESKNGTPIFALISINSCILCNFDTQTDIVSTSVFSAIKPNISSGNSVGLITHEQGSLYNTLITSVNDEYSSETKYDCAYDIKNVWSIEIPSFSSSIDFEFLSIVIEKKENESAEKILSIVLRNDEIGDLSIMKKKFLISNINCHLQMTVKLYQNSDVISSNTIIFVKNFVSLGNGTINVKSDDELSWDCQVLLEPFNYPIIFDTNSMKIETSLIFAPVFSANNPFSQKINNKSPMIIRIDCPKISSSNRYGIFKLEFELDLKSFNQIEEKEITALLQMKNIKPICSYQKIDDDLYSFKIPRKFLNSYFTENDTIFYYPIPFRFIEDDEMISPSIQIIDIFLSPVYSNEICDFDEQMFPSAYSFIHSACIAKDDDVKKIDYLKIHCDEHDINISQYIYPAKDDRVQSWRLIGFSLMSDNHSNQDFPHHLIIEQNETEFPTSKHMISIDHQEKDLYIKCTRCKAIRVYWNDDYKVHDSQYFYENKNQKFFVHTYSNRIYNLYAVCKDNHEKNCEKRVDNLNNLSLISVPIIGKILDENSYLTINDDYIKDEYTQLIYNRETINYITDLKSEIQKIISFNDKLTIRIDVKKIGPFIKISAIESNSNCHIPFTSNKNVLFDILLTESPINLLENSYYVSGSLFIVDKMKINIRDSVDVLRAPKLFDLPDHLSSQFESIIINNSKDIVSVDENKFCFCQNNEDYCEKSNGLPLKNPEFNEFLKNVASESIIIDIVENLSYFYPNFDSLKTQNLDVTFNCHSPKSLKGEMIIPPGVTVKFIGEFDLSDLYITTKVNWKNLIAGKMSFEKVTKYPVIDVENEDDSQEDAKSIDIILKGEPNLNLLTKTDSQNKNEYIIQNNKIYCLKRQTEFELKNDFCIYKTNRIACKDVNNKMNSISQKDLNNFPIYFKGAYNDEIKLHLAENIEFTEETLQTFFDNHPNIKLKIQSYNNHVSLTGILNCPKDITLLFKEDDDLDIQNLIINKSVSILYRIVSNDNGYIDLGDKKVKSITIYGQDIPQNSHIDDSAVFLMIRNCNQDLNISIVNNVLISEYMKTLLKPFYSKDNYYMRISSDVIYEYPNLFCVYIDVPHDFKFGHPIKSNEIKKIAKYIDTQNYYNITINILDDVNLELDISDLNGLKYVFINGSNLFKKLSGRIKISNKMKATLNELDIGNLTLDIDVNIQNNIASCYDIENCNGVPTIKIFPHSLPTNVETNSSILFSAIVLSCKEQIFISFDQFKFPMYGGFMHQQIHAEIVNGTKFLYLIYEYQQITIDDNQGNHYYLFQNNDSIHWDKANNNINISEFCLANFMDKSSSNQYIFKVSENITLPSPCILDVSKYSKKEILIFGDYFIKGNMTLIGEVDIIIFNHIIIDELQISLNITMPQNKNSNKIIVPSIITYEDAKPKSLNINILNYSREIEEYDFESRQFIKGICIKTMNNIPTPYTRDFRIRPICSNIDGIFGMKIRTLTQKYSPNKICFYNSSFSKCISDTKLESYLPVHYSEIPPSFTKGGDDPSIYLFDSPDKELIISFQQASLLNLKRATIVNNDNAKIKIFIPSDFILDTNESFSASEFYFQFKYNRYNNYKYGTLHCIGPNINIIPVPINHGTFIHDDKILLSERENGLASHFGQNQYVMSQIKYTNETIMIIDGLRNYQKFDKNIYEDIYIHQTRNVYLSSSQVFNPYKIYHKNLAIQSTISNTLTIDLTKVKNLNGNHIFISEVTINFTKEGDIDFEDLNITFRKCKLDKKWINKVKGKNLFFDSDSYYSFYNETGKIAAFNGDNIKIPFPNKISLQNDEYIIQNSTTVQLNYFNSFVDTFGETVKFTGNESILSIGAVTSQTNLHFHNFSHLAIITESMNGLVSLHQVKRCEFQLSSESIPINIDTIETIDNENDQTEIKSNGILNVKKLIVSSDFKAHSISQFNDTEIKENRKVTIQNGNFLDSITIKDNSLLILKSCNSLSEIKLKLNGHVNQDPKLILRSNNSIKFKSIEINMADQERVDKGCLIEGLTKCDNKLKKKIRIFNDISANIKKKYNLKCKKDSNSLNSLYIYHKKISNGAIAGIAVGAVAALVIFIIIVVCCFKKEKVDTQLQKDGNESKQSFLIP